MNKNTEFFLTCLNASINNKKVSWNSKYIEVDFEKIIDLAQKHDVVSLVYNSLSNTEYIKMQNLKLVDNLKCRAIGGNIYQIKATEKAGEIIKLLNEANIKVMLMKGLVLRKYYPRPELRTMGDVDILVESFNIEKVKDIVKKTDGKIGIEGNVHFAVSYKKILKMEIHSKIKEFDFNILELEDDVKSTYIDKINENIYELKKEKFLVHLCLHMFKHRIGAGFGIRPVIDLYLFIKNNPDIDWIKFNSDIKKFNIDKFIVSIFSLCSNIFGMKIPEVIVKKNIKIPDRYLDIFIDSIIESGVHGYAYKLRWLVKDSKKRALPVGEYLSDRYNYAKKYKVLIIVAWIDRIFVGLFVRNYKLKDFYYAITVVRKQIKVEKNFNLWLEQNN